MYIQPCCVDKELPPIVKQPFAFFQSNGDWDVSKLMSSVSYLIENPVCLMVIPEVNVFLLRTLNTYLEKDWYRSLCLLTAVNQTGLVKAEFGKNISCVHYANSKQVMDGQFALTNLYRHLVVQGPLLIENDFTLCNYSSFCGTDAGVFKSALEAAIPRLRMNATVTSDDELIVKLLSLDF